MASRILSLQVSLIEIICVRTCMCYVLNIFAFRGVLFHLSQFIVDIMDFDPVLKEAVKHLNMAEIVHALPERCFTSAQKRLRPEMDKAIFDLPSTHHDLLVNAFRAKRLRKTADCATDSTQSAESNTSPLSNAPNFFHTVSDECRKERIGKFIDATGNSALEEEICVVCAGRFRHADTEPVKLSDLEEKALLCPTRPHDAHDLTNGMLLHNFPSKTHTRSDRNGHPLVAVCNSCISYLRRNKTPPLALANEMWVGEIPLELKILTLPERILIARFFPAAYIVKLYPKKKGARFWANAHLHSGLRGNMSTYRLNTNDIVSMVGDNILPASSSILAATIGVTFVGPRNIPQKTMPGFLHVNRNRVRHTLQWLKQNNPVYEDIHICPDRLNDLPCDDVPPEIMSLVRCSDNAELLAAEHDDYVPDHADDAQGSSSFVSTYHIVVTGPVQVMQQASPVSLT